MLNFVDDLHLCLLKISFIGIFILPEQSSPGGRVYAMASTGEVEKRLWIATSVCRNYPVSTLCCLEVQYCVVHTY